MAYDFSAFEQLVKKHMEEYQVPSIALGVISGEDLIYQKYFGYKDREQKLSPDGNTLYACASVTKAMTATLLGILKDEGKIDWDTPVIEYLPEFRMYDDYATLHVTLKDMLSHNTGVPRYDTAWWHKPGFLGKTAEEYVHDIRYFKPNKGFRTLYEYNNYMFTAAGLAAGRVGGKPWGELITEKIFKPLGMKNTVTSFKGVRDAANRALPYILEKGKLQANPFMDFDGMAGCGAVNSTVEDMAKWAALNLNGGEYKGTRIISKETLAEIHAPRTVSPAIPQLSNAEMPLSAYGFGWGVTVFRGHPVLQHSGSIDGFGSFLGCLTREKLGVILFTNVSGVPLHIGAGIDLFDIMLGVSDRRDWMLDYKERFSKQSALAAAANPQILALVKPGAAPSHPLADYAGEYRFTGFSPVEVKHEGAKLSFNYAGLSLELCHNNYDSFHISAPLGGEEDIITLISFRKDAAGNIAGFDTVFEPAFKGTQFFAKIPVKAGTKK
jgi:CubicO group peptidase (beta-lactamase class C family)